MRHASLAILEFSGAAAGASSSVAKTAAITVAGSDFIITGKNVYIVDASVMPTTASTHTMVPVMAMADRAAHRMVKL